MSTRLKKYDIILFLLTLALVLVDWRINEFLTFSDLFLVLGFFSLILFKYVYIENKQQKLYLFVVAFILLNTVMQIVFNKDFIIEAGIISALKLSFYLALTILFYNLISNENLEIRLLEFLYKSTSIVCVIGIYIYIS